MGSAKGIQNPIMNRGRFLEHPLESSYAIARRILVANPNISLKKSSLLAEDVSRFEAVDSFEKYLPSSRRRISSVRQCSSCARLLFHPAVYELPALRLCPIHHSPLSGFCPDCGKSWTRPLTFRNPVCHTCGSPSWDTLGRIQIKQPVYRQLKWLNDWLTSCQSARETFSYPDLFDIYKKLRPLRNIERPSFTQPCTEHLFYAAFESQKQDGIPNPRLARLHVITYNHALRTRKTQLARWYPPAWPEDLDVHEMPDSPYLPPKSTLVTLISLAIRRILRWQHGVTGAHHRLNWYDIRGIRPEQVREGSPPCILCLAFSFWCRAILLKFIQPHSGGEPGDHELCRFTGYYRYPNIPEGVYVEDAQGHLYRPSGSFERWLFLRSSDFAFMEFVKLASWIYQRAADKNVKFCQTSYPLSESFRRATQPSEILEVRHDQDQLQAVFWPQTPMNDIELSDEEVRKVQRCPAFLKCDCQRIWSVDSVPEHLHQSTVAELLDVILPQIRMRPYLYPWTDHLPLNSPSIGLLRSDNDMRAIKRAY